jgi:predicted nucleotide-binding protein (sugar kinase/HSP70/actin superfamily)
MTQAGMQSWEEAERVLTHKPVFKDGDRVRINLGRLTGEGGIVTGTVLGLAMVHVIDTWIVQVDPDQGLPNETYPYRAFVCPHGHLEAA